MSVARRVVVVVIIELLFVVATRLVLHYYSWQSVEAESIRTVLRIATAIWWLLKPLILSQKPNLRSTLKSSLVMGLLLLLSIPVLVGQYELARHVAILFALTSIPVAVKEEFLFRGIVQNLLLEKLGSVKATLLTSVIFTLWHVGVWSPTFWTFGQIFLVSVLLGLVYVGSRSIMVVIVIHAVYDALFSFTPLMPTPLDANWGFIPLFGSVAFVIYWAFRGTKEKACQVKEIS